jgi:hypothetical protein
VILIFYDFYETDDFYKDPEKQRFAEELLACSDAFNQAMLASLTSEDVVTAEAGQN